MDRDSDDGDTWAPTMTEYEYAPGIFKEDSADDEVPTGTLGSKPPTILSFGGTGGAGAANPKKTSSPFSWISDKKDSNPAHDHATEYASIGHHSGIVVGGSFTITDTPKTSGSPLKAASGLLITIATAAFIITAVYFAMRVYQRFAQDQQDDELLTQVERDDREQVESKMTVAAVVSVVVVVLAGVGLWWTRDRSYEYATTSEEIGGHGGGSFGGGGSYEYPPSDFGGGADHHHGMKKVTFGWLDAVPTKTEGVPWDDGDDVDHDD